MRMKKGSRRNRGGAVAVVGSRWSVPSAKRTSSDILLNNKTDSDEVDDEDRNGGNV